MVFEFLFHCVTVQPKNFISVLFLKILGSLLRPMVKYGAADSRLPCGLHIRETKTILVRPTRLRLGGSAARPLRPQIKDGVVLEY